MSEPKTYTLYLSMVLKIFIFGILGLFAVFGILLILFDIFLFPGGNGPPWFVGLVSLLLAGYTGYWTFSFPHKIIVYETGDILFLSPIRKRQTAISEIKSIKPDPTQLFGFLVVKTKILNQFDGFHEFLTDLKMKNPSVKLHGC